MGLMDWLFGQFIDIIEWKDNTQDTILWRFPRDDGEIKYGAKLIVRESQIAVFVDKGEIADILEPGTYTLETDNLPILTDLRHWDHGFKSPFKVDVYFINTKLFSQKWGTKNPIIVRDKEFDSVRLKAFGSYEFKVSDPKKFIREVVGTDGHFTVDEVDTQLTNLILAKLPVILAQSGESVLDMAASYENFGEFLKGKLQEDFNNYGLKLDKLLVENISLPEEVEKAIDKRASRKAVGNLDEHMKYQGAEALGSGGGASEVASIGAGIAMANEISKSFNNSSVSEKSGSMPPPVPGSKPFYIVKAGKADGPHTIDDIKTLIANGQLKPASYIWQEGLEGWVKASELIGDLFKTTPPPIPNA